MNQREYLEYLITKYERLYETTIELVSVVEDSKLSTRTYSCEREGIITNLELKLLSWQINNLVCTEKPINCVEEM